MTTPNPDSVVAAVSSLVVVLNDGTVDFDATRSPAAAERVGEAIAQRLRQFKPETLFTWDEAADAIIAHVAARQLGIRAALFRVDEGLIYADVELVRGRRAGLVVARPPDRIRYDALQRFISTHDGTLVVTAEVVGASASAAREGHVVLVGSDQLGSR